VEYTRFYGHGGVFIYLVFICGPPVITGRSRGRCGRAIYGAVVSFLHWCSNHSITKRNSQRANNLSIDFSTIQQESRRDSISSYLQSTSASSSEKSVRAPNLTSLASLIAPQPNNVNGHDVNGLSGMRGVHDVNGHLPGGKAENRAGVDDQE